MMLSASIFRFGTQRFLDDTPFPCHLAEEMKLEETFRTTMPPALLGQPALRASRESKFLEETTNNLMFCKGSLVFRKLK